MRAAVAIALLAAGCTRILGVHDFPPEVVDNKTCYGRMFPVCFEAALPDPRTLSGSIDTDDSLCRGTLSDGSPACIIAATDLTVTDVHAHGSLPLVLIAQDQLTVTGLLDVASHGTQIGPNGSSPECIPATPGWGEDQNNLRASGGGAGGSFGTAGGDGGAVQAMQGNGGLIGGGRANPIAQVIALRGGCAGSAGGIETVGIMGGGNGIMAAEGGAGGGAVLLVADAIQIDGTVDASGAGGAAGAASGGAGNLKGNGGGGGGGSGGLIAIDAAIEMVSGMLVAHGGGGGGGGERGTTGSPGADGAPPLDDVAAGGMSQGPQSGAGGHGAGDGMAAAAGALEPNSDSGSGGGGGGAGVILSVLAIANASPAVSPP